MKNKLVKYLLAGLGYLLPIAALVYLIYFIFTYIDGYARDLIPDKYEFPGLGFVALLLFLIVFGWFTTISKIDDWAKEKFIQLLNRIPLLKNIYSSLEDITSALVGEKKTFDRPVLVKLSKDMDAEQIGFIAKDDLSSLGIENGKIAVAVPFTFSYMFKICIVPVENITSIKAKSSEVMKFVVSGGLTQDRNKKSSIITDEFEG